MSRSTTMLGTPTLGIISETSMSDGPPVPGQGGADGARGHERPGMVTTESTVPLLSDRRRSSSSKLKTSLHLE